MNRLALEVGLQNPPFLMPDIPFGREHALPMHLREDINPAFPSDLFVVIGNE